MITVKLYAFYRRKHGSEIQLPVSDYPTPQAVLDYLELPEKLGILLVNGFHQSVDYQLKDGDIISLFPNVAGG